MRARRVVGGIELGAIATTLGKTLAATVPAVVAVVATRRLLGGWWRTLWQQGSSLESFGVVAALGVLALAIVAAGFVILRVEVVSLLLRRGRHESKNR